MSAAASVFAESFGLDDVDLGRQVARDLKANFLLTNLRLVPDLHNVLLRKLLSSDPADRL